MKHTLTLTGSSAALAAAMTAFEAVEGKAPSAALATPHTLADAPSTSTGTGTPVAPAMPSAPSGATPMPTAPAPMSGAEDDSDDDDGDDTDGSGLDSNGLPWDERIHSGSKKRGQDGTWNKRRGGPKGAELAAIEMELRASQPSAPMPMPAADPTPPAPPPMPTAGAAPAPMPMPAEPTPPAPPPMPPAPPPMPTATAMPAAEPPATPAMPVSAAPAGAPTGLDFPTLMQTIGPKMGEGAGQIDAGYLQGVCQVYGLNSLTDLALKPELIDAVVAQFAADGRW